MTRIIAALYVDPRGCYSGLEGVDLWDEKRDARLYAGPHPVVAHPPCSTWCQMAAVNQARYGHAIGSDGGCFAAALDSVRTWGGVLEHPAYSYAWPRFGLRRPHKPGGWLPTRSASSSPSSGGAPAASPRHGWGGWPTTAPVRARRALGSGRPRQPRPRSGMPCSQWPAPPASTALPSKTHQDAPQSEIGCRPLVWCCRLVNAA